MAEIDGALEARSSRKRKSRDVIRERAHKKSKNTSSQMTRSIKSKLGKSWKTKEAAELSDIDNAGDENVQIEIDSRSMQKSKDKDKIRKDTSSKTIESPSTNESAAIEINDKGTLETEDAAINEHDAIAKNTRFIVFVGNLPYTATTASLESHFSALKPTSVRHITQKDDPTKSKGFAFLEFTDYKRMRTCLKQFHHTQFDDGKSPARRINVELTAGGGGHGKQRRQKLKAKNEKLGSQRQRQNMAVKEAKPKQLNESIGGEDKGLPVQNKHSAASSSGDIHPSRRARVKQ